MLDALLDASKQHGATIVLNATPEAIGAKPLLDRVDVLVVNETEAEDLLGHAVSAGNGEEAARSWLSLDQRRSSSRSAPRERSSPMAARRRHCPRRRSTSSIPRAPVMRFAARLLPIWRAGWTHS